MGTRRQTCRGLSRDVKESRAALREDRFPMPYSFEANVYKTSRGFTIPKDVRDGLGVKDGDSVFLTIESPDGRLLFKGRKTLKSGPEIYGKDVAHALTPGTKIVARASRPESPTKVNLQLKGRAPAGAKQPSRSNREVANARRFWVVSPECDQITLRRSVSGRQPATRLGQHLSGWGPDDQGHGKIGYNFAHEISPGDIILNRTALRG